MKMLKTHLLIINTGGTPLSTEEVNYLANRRSPVARAMTGIISNGSKDALWLGHADKCIELSQQLYNALLSPSDSISKKIKVTDYPLCLLKKKNSFDRYQFLQGLFTISTNGQTGADKIRKTIAYLANEENDSKVANATLQHLEDVQSLLSHIWGKQSQSIGLLPVFYFYSTKGQFRQTLFFLFLAWISKGSDKDIKQRKLEFTLVRETFEEVWMLIKDYVFKGLGRKGVGPYRLTKNHIQILDKLLADVKLGKEERKDSLQIAASFLQQFDPKVHNEFQTEMKGHTGKSFKHFSQGTKTQQEMFAFFDGIYRCELCNGAVDIGVSQQVDHKTKRSQGGTNHTSNARIVHPWCNNNRDRIELVISIDDQVKNNIKMENSVTPTIKPEPDLTKYDTDAKQLSFELSFND